MKQEMDDITTRLYAIESAIATIAASMKIQGPLAQQVEGLLQSIEDDPDDVIVGPSAWSLARVLRGMGG